MAEDRFIVRTKKTYTEHQVVSCRMAIELIRKLDDVSNRTGRTRNELIQKCGEYALEKIVILIEKEY